MTVIFATLGYTPEKVTHSVRAEHDVRAVVVFVGTRKRENVRAIEAVRRVCRPLDVPVSERVIGSAYDFVGAVHTYREAIETLGAGPAVFNISGGTGVMQAAAAFESFVHGLPMVYYNKEEGAYVRLPQVRLELGKSVSPQQLRILHALLTTPAGLVPSEAARRVKISPSNLDYHVRRLRAEGLVASSEENGSSRRRLMATDLARLVFWSPPRKNATGPLSDTRP